MKDTITKEMVETAEAIENTPAPVPTIRKGEMVTGTKCEMVGYSTLFKAWRERQNAPTMFEGAAQFGFRRTAWKARRAKNAALDDKGVITATAYIPTWRKGNEWGLVADELAAHGVAVPQSVNLETAKKIQHAFAAIFINGRAPSEVLANGKKPTLAELQTKYNSALEELAMLRELVKNNAPEK